MGVEAKERDFYKEAGHYSTDTENLEENPPCNAEDNLRAEENLVQGLLRESWIRGCPDSRTISFGRTVGL